MEITDSDLKWVHWDEENYKANEKNIFFSSVQITAGSTEENDFGILTLRIRYGFEYNGERVFSCLAEKTYIIQLAYISINCLRFLTEVALDEFYKGFIEKKSKSIIYRQKVKKLAVERFYDDLDQALLLIRSALAK